MPLFTPKNFKCYCQVVSDNTSARARDGNFGLGYNTYNFYTGYDLYKMYSLANMGQCVFLALDKIARKKSYKSFSSCSCRPSWRRSCSRPQLRSSWRRCCSWHRSWRPSPRRSPHPCCHSYRSMRCSCPWA
jgi:hypothetical protein